jgi:hypothetical protein
MPDFIPGRALSLIYFEEAVQPILAAHFPTLVYSAALIHTGSDVLGFDTAQSMDHHWGPRLSLFLAPEDMDLKPVILDTLRRHLPVSIRGFSTHFGPPDRIGVRLLQPLNHGPVDPLISIQTVSDFWVSYLGLDPRQGLSNHDWLTLPEQKLLTITAGPVHHDGLGELARVREALAYYPHDVWLYLMAVQWSNISEEEAFVGRTGDVGDELGSRVIAARQVERLMRLCFLQERRYAPYSKWLGTAFARLTCAAQLAPLFDQILSATTWREREAGLSAAYETVAQMHNRLGLTDPLNPTVRPYYSRPYYTLGGDAYAAALCAAIQEEDLRRRPLLGSVDQLTHNVDLLSNSGVCRRLVLALAGQGPHETV